MNCKPGDLAMRVKYSSIGFVPVGAVVEVLELRESSMDMSDRLVEKVWLVEYRGLTYGPQGFRLGVPDCDLRPLRDNDGTDEMLRIAGLPHNHKQPQEA